MICVFYPFKIQLINENSTEHFCGTFFVGELKTVVCVASNSDAVNKDIKSHTLSGPAQCTARLLTTQSCPMLMSNF